MSSGTVDALVGEPLDGLDAPALQARIVALTPQVTRLQGWQQVPTVRILSRRCSEVRDRRTVT